MDEQRAIELCVKHRDPVGFEFLVQKYRREAYRHAFALLGNAEDALDACQDAFAKAFAAIPRLSDLPQFYPWFYCILRNRCFNLIARRQTSDRYRAMEQQNPARSTDTATPAQLMEQSEDRQRVWDAMASLTPEHREILAMKYVCGHSYDEIARTLRISRGTVMSRLYHARMAFREAFLKLDEAPNAKPEEKSL
ncbi:MAG: RNA polymerase sigma factor [Verrucomicrobia bacterium]|nr:RNA polymerase sigma factor [Verrucomicrobiota bacterium]